MALTLEQRVKRLEKKVARITANGRTMDGQGKEKYIAWQKRRVEELVAEGLSNRQAKNKAWHEAQRIDFSKES
ncbi:hypothetical protein SLP22_0045 [Salmonella phage BAU.Micro_SLP-22]|nr:hypothetical protein SLP22_00032 [Salmonella phage BAU.Micro_SLP-22]